MAGSLTMNPPHRQHSLLQHLPTRSAAGLACSTANGCPGSHASWLSCRARRRACTTTGVHGAAPCCSCCSSRGSRDAIKSASGSGSSQHSACPCCARRTPPSSACRCAAASGSPPCASSARSSCPASSVCRRSGPSWRAGRAASSSACLGDCGPTALDPSPPSAAAALESRKSRICRARG